MSSRGGTELGRLVRLGFADPLVSATALTEAGFWLEGGAADEDSAAVVQSLSETPDPDLAAAALGRLLLALRRPEELRSRLRSEAGLRQRLLGVLGTSIALGDHLAAFPDDWHVLADDDVTSVRPSRFPSWIACHA